MLAFAAARDSSSSKRHLKLSPRLQQSLLADDSVASAPRPPRAKKARVVAASPAAADAGELGELVS